MRSTGFSFTELGRSGHARRGRFVTPRATIETPVFMPVGTAATVKSQTPDEVASTGARIILANTYHLWLRPGAERIGDLGGVPKFMGWPHAMLTDSGGFQVFSLGAMNAIDDEGVTFRSHLDGRKMRLTPEESMRVQALLGADVAMAFDECPPGGAEKAITERAMARTTAWARRCLRAPWKDGQARFGIVQGGTDLSLRQSHLETIATMREDDREFDGIALGGFSVGEPIAEMYGSLDALVPSMPTDRPRYLMGVGTPFDLLRGMGAGIDLFDCVLPTRNARNGQALTWSGRVNLKQARHQKDESPLDAQCDCTACTRFTRAYVHHLIKADEMLGARLITQHNLHFYGALTRAGREAIEHDRYAAFADGTARAMKEGDEIGAVDQRTTAWKAPGDRKRDRAEKKAAAQKAARESHLAREAADREPT